MGRLTHESIGKPLPDRRNIVVSRRAGLEIDGCEVVATPDDALSLAADAEEVMIIGGRQIYEHMLPKADRIYMTRIHASPDGDTFFPELNDEEWQVVEQEDFAADDSRPYDFSFKTLDRIS